MIKNLKSLSNLSNIVTLNAAGGNRTVNQLSYAEIEVHAAKIEARGDTGQNPFEETGESNPRNTDIKYFSGPKNTQMQPMNEFRAQGNDKFAENPFADGIQEDAQTSLVNQTGNARYQKSSFEKNNNGSENGNFMMESVSQQPQTGEFSRIKGPIDGNQFSNSSANISSRPQDRQTIPQLNPSNQAGTNPSAPQPATRVPASGGIGYFDMQQGDQVGAVKSPQNERANTSKQNLFSQEGQNAQKIAQSEGKKGDKVLPTNNKDQGKEGVKGDKASVTDPKAVDQKSKTGGTPATDPKAVDQKSKTGGTPVTDPKATDAKGKTGDTPVTNPKGKTGDTPATDSKKPGDASAKDQKGKTGDAPVTDQKGKTGDASAKDQKGKTGDAPATDSKKPADKSKDSRIPGPSKASDSKSKTPPKSTETPKAEDAETPADKEDKTDDKNKDKDKNDKEKPKSEDKTTGEQVGSAMSNSGSVIGKTLGSAIAPFMTSIGSTSSAAGSVVRK